MEEQGIWYKDWFGSPYYDLLYQHRDNAEALAFVANLINYLKPATDARVLDIACGEGRYAYQLATAGLYVIGIDLSQRRLDVARSRERSNLHFYQQDMRFPFRINYFDYAFNFFTSFGYFYSMRDNVSAAKAFTAGLKNGGLLIIDFMNAHVSAQNLIPSEEKTIKGITFKITRKLEDKRFLKDISFISKEGAKYHFQERVWAFELADFKQIFADTGMVLKETFGNYELAAFDREKSPRLIMIFQKEK